MRLQGRTVNGASDFPTEEHFAIIKYFTANTSTYELNDGSVSGCEYEVFTNKEAWLKEIEYLTRSQTPFNAMLVKPAKVTVQTKIDVS
jgi:hypothetical protein